MHIYIIMKAVNGLLMTQRQITLKDVWGYNVRKRHRPRMSDAFLADTVDTTCIWLCGVQCSAQSVSQPR